MNEAVAGGPRRKAGLVVAIMLLGAACGPAGSKTNDAGDAAGLDSIVDDAAVDAAADATVDATVDTTIIDGNVEHDPAGWAIVGRDLFPPLVRRVAALPCPGERRAIDQCMSDAECGAGFACACHGPQGFDAVNLCVRAECRSDADCSGGACLLSLGSKPDACCSYGHLGLFCERSGSTCRDGADCPGNGRACMYAPANDRFECQPFSCACP